MCVKERDWGAQWEAKWLQKSLRVVYECWDIHSSPSIQWKSQQILYKDIHVSHSSAIISSKYKNVKLWRIPGVSFQLVIFFSFVCATHTNKSYPPFYEILYDVKHTMSQPKLSASLWRGAGRRNVLRTLRTLFYSQKWKTIHNRAFTSQNTHHIGNCHLCLL